MSLQTNALPVIILTLVVTTASFYPQEARGQSGRVDIRGIVTDSTNGERLPGVNVRVEGTGRGWVTNVNGFYLIAAVPRGRHTVTASAVGYWSRGLTVDVEGSEPISLNIVLVPRVIESSEVMIEGEREEEAVQRSASIHIVTPHDLQQVPSAAQADLFRTMELLPGISSTSDVNSKFYVRGGAGDQNLVLLDGMKLFNPFHAYGSFGVLDPQIIKSAEIYTGAFPANYGDRLSSVVNVTTRDGNRSNFAANAGINFLSANLGLEGPINGDNSWLVSGRKSLFAGTLQRIVPSAAPASFYDLFFKGTTGSSTERVVIRGFISDDRITPVDPAQPDHRWRSAALAGVVSGLITDRIYMDLTLDVSSSEVALWDYRYGVDPFRWPQVQDDLESERMSSVSVALRSEHHTWEGSTKETVVPHAIDAFRAENGKTLLDISYAISLEDFVEAAGDTARTLPLEVGISLISLKGGKSRRELDTLRVPVTPGAKGAYVSLFKRTLSPDSVRVAMHVRSAGEKVIGTWSEFLTVPDFRGKSFSLSGIQLLLPSTRPASIEIDGVRTLQSPFRAYRRDARLYTYLQIYNLVKDAGGKAKYTAVYELIPRDPLRPEDSIRLGEVTRDLTEDSRADFLPVDLSAVTPGKYLLRATVTDRKRVETLTRDREIDILP
jgi:hypothetical protein